MRCAIFASLGIVAAAGCSKKAQDGLPPATEWQASPSAESSPGGPAMQSRRMGGAGAMGRSGPMAGRDSNNPHAGLDMPSDDPSDPHAGLDMSGDVDPSDPHAGVDMSGDGDSSNPHAGLGATGNPHGTGGTDVTKLGLSAPDPDRQIDPGHRVTGVIGIAAKAKDRVKPGNAVFLIVKRAGPDGAPSGPPLAVDKLTWTGDGMPFELTEAQAMIAGTDLSGDVIVTARYDQDGDALTKQPGDVTGQLSVKIPADRVKLMLDTVLP
jgi:hypothetical protein